MPLTCENSPKGVARANQIFVDTTISDDGRNTEGFWADCDISVPDQSKAMALFIAVLENSSDVRSYSLYGANGDRLTNFESARFPKRV